LTMSRGQVVFSEKLLQTCEINTANRG
jgi:hypothetical protein